MWPSNWSGWSQAESDAISKFAAGFQPQWRPPSNAFGDWHYLVLGGELNNRITAFLGNAFHFNKPVTVLMDGDCFSATSIFLSAMGKRHDVTLIGTPAPAGSGRLHMHRISVDPDFEISLSTMASFMSNDRLFDGNVIEPDIEVWPTLADLAGESDSQLNAAVAQLTE